jgi:Membrane proteins related to metalloendopeptidases
MTMVALLCVSTTGYGNADVPAVTEMTISPGEIRLLKFKSAENNLEIVCRDQKVLAQKNGDEYLAIVVESYFSELKSFECALKDPNKTISTVKFTVLKREYKTEKLRVEPKLVELSAKDEERRKSEREITEKIYKSSANKLLINSAFIKPLKSKITSVYGTSRSYNGVKKGQHLGVDFRAAIGKKIPSANDGVVAYSGEFLLAGNVVIIDHGLGVFTSYAHLSKRMVEAGDTITQGQIIGLGGNTGRSNGPHLHWTVTVHGEQVDGLNVIEEFKSAFK